MIILASKSPRREEILRLAGINFIVKKSNQQETIDPNLTPQKAAELLAVSKAKEIATHHPFDAIIGADTIVVIDDIILGKPASEKEAIWMLKKLSGRTHQVITGVALINNQKVFSFSEITLVTFSKMTESEMIEYIKTEYVYDKAGGYAIQGAACKFITRIEGDYYNVMGLPMAKLYQHLKENKLI